MTLRNAPGATSATSDRKDDLTSLPMSEVDHLQRADASPSALAGDLNVYSRRDGRAAPSLPLLGSHEVQHATESETPRTWPRLIRSSAVIAFPCGRRCVRYCASPSARVVVR